MLGGRLHLLQNLGRVGLRRFHRRLFSQRILGWHAATDRRTDLVLTPLRIALWDRDRQGQPIAPGALVHHSDAGQYTSIRFTEHLELQGIAPSIGTVGDAYDCEDVGCREAA
jgi:putative transposase